MARGNFSDHLAVIGSGAEQSRVEWNGRDRRALDRLCKSARVEHPYASSTADNGAPGNDGPDASGRSIPTAMTDPRAAVAGLIYDYAELIDAGDLEGVARLLPLAGC